MKKISLSLFIFLLLNLTLNAEIKLPAVFSDNMVLQQKSIVKLWGKSIENKQITITASWLNMPINVLSDANGNWKTTIKTPKAGGPYSLSFSDGTNFTLNNVMIGEVWFCAGQSNMQMTLKGYDGQPVNESQQTIANANAQVPIRIFKVERRKSIVPQDSISGIWKINTPENVSNTSAVAYFFAQRLQSALKVPVGIIISSWGGTEIQAFMDSLTLSKFEKVNTPSKNTAINEYPVHCELYNGMIYPLRDFSIKGFLWYQGEANAFDPAGYKLAFPAMVSQWRGIWHDDKLPFYFTQIAPYKYNGIDKRRTAYFKEMQQGLMTSVPNSGMVVTADVGDSAQIHPPMKKEIGLRLSKWVLARTYNFNNVHFRSPEFKSLKIKNGAVIIDFDNEEKGLHSTTSQIEGFEIAGSDRVFKKATAELIRNGKMIRVSESTVQKPVAVRYCFKNYSKVTLYNSSENPLTLFRTDNWEE